MTTRKPAPPNIPEELLDEMSIAAVCETAIGAGYIGHAVNKLPEPFKVALRGSLAEVLNASEEELPPLSRFLVQFVLQASRNELHLPEFLDIVGNHYGHDLNSPSDSG